MTGDMSVIGDIIANSLLDDFFDEVEPVLRDHGIPTTVVSEEDTRRSK